MVSSGGPNLWSAKVRTRHLELLDRGTRRVCNVANFMQKYDRSSTESKGRLKGDGENISRRSSTDEARVRWTVPE